MVKVGPSLLAADFRVMGAEIERMAEAGADYLHFETSPLAPASSRRRRKGRCRWTRT